MKRYSVTDTAKLIRQALKAAFPKTRFSVRCDRYAGGASIDVSWVDGPTEAMVNAVVKPFEGAAFDGMTDLKVYKEHVWDGERVRFGADYVFASRRYSRAFCERALASLKAQGVLRGSVWLEANGNNFYLVGNRPDDDRLARKALEHRAAEWPKASPAKPEVVGVF